LRLVAGRLRQLADVILKVLAGLHGRLGAPALRKREISNDLQGNTTTHGPAGNLTGRSARDACA
jgi:hypothetical protein